MSELQEYESFATTLSLKAGEIMLKYFQIGITKKDKEDGTPVTIVDTKINQMVIDAIKKQYTGHAIHGEEASHKKENAEYVWVCDPIDGTIPYTFGIPISKFSLALVKNGKPIIGVIYDPYLKRLYHATQGGGAFLNEDNLHVNNHTTLLAGKYISLSTQKVTFLDSGSLIREANMRGLWTYSDLCFTDESMLTASGQLIGNVFGYPSAHDVAAVKLIIEEAGGKVTDLLGNEQRYDQPIKGAIVSNGLVHDELIELVKPYLELDG